MTERLTLLLAVSMACIAASPAIAQTLQRVPNRVDAPHRTPASQTSTPEPAQSNTSSSQSNTQSAEAEAPAFRTAVVFCTSVDRTKFAYGLNCFSEPDYRGEMTQYHFVFRRDGTEPEWALNADDFPAIQDLVMGGTAGTKAVVNDRQLGWRHVRTFFVNYYFAGSHPTNRYCRSDMPYLQGTTQSFCYELFAFRAASPSNLMNANEVRH